MKCSATLMAASAMASGKATLLACIVHVSKRSALLPAEWISALAGAGGAADGQLLQRPAVAARGMAFEVGEHEHGVVAEDVPAHAVFP